MAHIPSWTLLFTATVLVVALAMCSGTEGAGLEFGFYRKSCPQAEATIYKSLHKQAQKDPAIRADILRLHFHDCFVRGCDASVLLEGKGTERAAPPNFRLEGFKVIENIKEEVEKICPETVSCADILAYAARDSVQMAQGPNWAVRGGRRDGVVSKASEAVANLPGADMNVNELVASFAKQGLTQEEMVILSGGHTIGDAACVHIDSRIHTSMPDPLLPKDFLDELKYKCPKPGKRLSPTVEFDQMTGKKFDTKYYENLKERKGLLTSDQVLFEDASTRHMVLANTVQDVFFKNFKMAMVKMSEILPLTGTQGEIRLNCKEINKAIKKDKDDEKKEDEKKKKAKEEKMREAKDGEEDEDDD